MFKPRSLTLNCCYVFWYGDLIITFVSFIQSLLYFICLLFVLLFSHISHAFITAFPLACICHISEVSACFLPNRSCHWLHILWVHFLLNFPDLVNSWLCSTELHPSMAFDYFFYQFSLKSRDILLNEIKLDRCISDVCQLFLVLQLNITVF